MSMREGKGKGLGKFSAEGWNMGKSYKGVKTARMTKTTKP